MNREMADQLIKAINEQVRHVVTKPALTRPVSAVHGPSGPYDPTTAMNEPTSIVTKPKAVRKSKKAQPAEQPALTRPMSAVHNPNGSSVLVGGSACPKECVKEKKPRAPTAYNEFSKQHYQQNKDKYKGSYKAMLQDPDFKSAWASAKK